MSLLRRASSKLRNHQKDPSFEPSSSANSNNNDEKLRFGNSARDNGGGRFFGRRTQSAPDLLISKLKTELLEGPDTDEEGSINGLSSLRRANSTANGRDVKMPFMDKINQLIAANMQPEYYDDAPELQAGKRRSGLFRSKSNKSTNCLHEFATVEEEFPIRKSSESIRSKHSGIFRRSNSFKRSRTPAPVFETGPLSILPSNADIGDDTTGLTRIQIERPPSPKRFRYRFFHRGSHSANLLVDGMPIFNAETGEYHVLDLAPEYYDDAPERFVKKLAFPRRTMMADMRQWTRMEPSNNDAPTVIEPTAAPAITISRASSRRTVKSVSFIDLQKSKGVEDENVTATKSCDILRDVSQNVESNKKKATVVAQKQEWKGKGILKKQPKAVPYQPYEGLRHGKAGSSILNPRTFDSLNSFSSKPTNNPVEEEEQSFTYEHGRRYHRYKSFRRYFMPNDEQEQIRLNLQHFLFGDLQKGALYQAPISTSTAERVLDLGTGTGIWAIEMGHLLPNSRVWGIDLSPTQPTDPEIVPKNVIFTTGDIEDEWKYPHEFFDFIYARNLSGAVADWPKLVKKAFDYLKPGGYFEILDSFLHLRCSPGSVDPHGTLIQWNTNLLTYLRQSKRSATFPPQAKQILEMLGFVDIVCKIIRLPNGSWMGISPPPSPTTRHKPGSDSWFDMDGHLMKVGHKQKEVFDESVEALTLRLFMEYGGLKEGECGKLVEDVRREVREKGLESWFDVYSVYGRKPYTKEFTPMHDYDDCKLEEEEEDGDKKKKKWSKKGKGKGKRSDSDYNKYGEDDMLGKKEGWSCVAS